MTTLRLSQVAHFPVHCLLENVVVRPDGSVLVTTINQHELWYVPPAREGGLIAPSWVHTYSYPLTGIAELEADRFCVCDVHQTHVSSLQRFDLVGWQPGTPIALTVMTTFDQSARGLNGMCVVAPGVLLFADCFAGLVWRVEVPTHGGTGVACVTTHRENTIDRVRLDPSGDGRERDIVAGDPVDPVLMGPSGAHWSRQPGEAGRVHCIISDGGTTGVPADGIVRTAKVLRAGIT